MNAQIFKFQNSASNRANQRNPSTAVCSIIQIIFVSRQRKSDYKQRSSFFSEKPETKTEKTEKSEQQPKTAILDITKKSQRASDCEIFKLSPFPNRCHLFTSQKNRQLLTSNKT